jgi:hypothetical protein
VLRKWQQQYTTLIGLIVYEYLSALPDNNHIASAWGKLGGGFSGAFINGYNTATTLLKRYTEG